MRHHEQFYINGQWVDPVGGGEAFAVINPATEAIAGSIRLGSEADVERAIAAARRAFDSFSQTSLQERQALVGRICAVYERRLDDMAQVITEEMGAPLHRLSRPAQAPLGLWHFQTALAASASYPFERSQGGSLILREAIGVCTLITPWNWPMGQVTSKVAPALLAGCTMVLKPSEFAPFSAQVFAEILHEAGVPPGVFNMLHGDGARVGPLLASHRDVDMVSLTGSTRSGVSVARNAADGIKNLSLELGGKSANLILDDAPLEEAVTKGVMEMMFNTGQSCNAPSRMLVPREKLAQAERIAASAVQRLVVGDPSDVATTTGPVANQRQFDRVQALIEAGIREGATLVAGGCGRFDGLSSGYFAKPTVFSHANNQMRIAREEIFGPVLTLLAYDSEDEAIAIANDSDYGLSGYVWGGTVERAAAVARRLRTGMVHLNGAGVDPAAPFGGYKQSGIGRGVGSGRAGRVPRNQGRDGRGCGATLMEAFDVLIIGAGVSGIGMACTLSIECPDKTFAILERRQRLGGTWDLFDYPGVRSDSDMLTYGYRFRPWQDAKVLADGATIRSYLVDTANEYGVDKKIRYGLQIKRADWSKALGRWTVTAVDEAGGEIRLFSAAQLVMCTGYYNYDVGYTPEFPGVENFSGQRVHPQHWPRDLALEGQRVVVVGSGATAMTLVPALAQHAAHVTMLQRSPTYVLSVPSHDRVTSLLSRLMPKRWAFTLARRRNTVLARWLYQACRRWPERMRSFILKQTDKHLAGKQRGPQPLHARLHALGPAPVHRAGRRSFRGAEGRQGFSRDWRHRWLQWPHHSAALRQYAGG